MYFATAIIYGYTGKPMPRCLGFDATELAAAHRFVAMEPQAVLKSGVYNWFVVENIVSSATGSNPKVMGETWYEFGYENNVSTMIRTDKPEWAKTYTMFALT